MSKTLLIMAAGMGSRFGAPESKQITNLGPNGELLMEYSVYDARLAGFDKFVFIISKKMRDFFPELITSKIGSENVFFAEQSYDSLPDWFTVPEGRTKPYGTASAVLSAKDIISEPFAVINADDFYGRQAFIDLSAALDRLSPSGEACMLTYRLASTLSGCGGVTRGICKVDENGDLLGISETKGLLLSEDGTVCVYKDDGSARTFDPDLPASMNIFGFTPWTMELLAEGFDAFLRDVPTNKADSAECPIPVLLDGLITEGKLRLHAVQTASRWFGVTYQEDIPDVKTALAELSNDYR